MDKVDELKTEKGDGPENGGEKDKISFHPEQQAKVQKLIDEAYRKAYAKAQRNVSSSGEVEELKGEIEKLRQEKKTSTLLRSIARHNVVDAEEVADLLRDKIRLDDYGNCTVVGDAGSTVINNTGSPMGVEEFVATWLSERPHHLRSSGSSGAGSESVRFGGSVRRYDLTDPAAWRNMPREDLDAILREGVNVQGAAGQLYRFRDVTNPFTQAKKRKHGSPRGTSSASPE